MSEVDDKRTASEAAAAATDDDGETPAVSEGELYWHEVRRQWTRRGRTTTVTATTTATAVVSSTATTSVATHTAVVTHEPAGVRRSVDGGVTLLVLALDDWLSARFSLCCLASSAAKLLVREPADAALCASVPDDERPRSVIERPAFESCAGGRERGTSA